MIKDFEKCPACGEEARYNRFEAHYYCDNGECSVVLFLPKSVMEFIKKYGEKPQVEKEK